MTKTKKCPSCRRSKPLKSFGKKTSYCKPCKKEKSAAYYQKNLVRARKMARDHYYANIREVRKRVLKHYHKNRTRLCKERNQDRKDHPAKRLNEIARAYGLTLHQYLGFLKRQKGLCAICKVDLNDIPTRSRHIDHCHNSKKVRGILCRWCNLMLGNARDSVEILRAGAMYLKRIR